MSKDSIRTYSSTAASNTDVGGVDIQGTAPASNMDDGLREIMSHLAETNAGTSPVDDTWSFCDPADATKKFRFDGGSITAGNTRVMTIPDADMTLGNLPATNDGAALGSASKSWSDLFLASGAVINFANGNYTVTHSSGTLTLSGALSIGTSNAFTAGTIELGAASDTTLSRGAAGFIAVEGNRVPSPASQAAGDILYRGSTEWERLAKGTASQVLRMNAGATAPEWATLSVDYGAGNAALAYGAVGTYVVAHNGGSTALNANDTIAGSSLEPGGLLSSSPVGTDDGAEAASITKAGSALSGTWRVMGQVSANSGSSRGRMTLFLRIS